MAKFRIAIASTDKHFLVETLKLLYRNRFVQEIFYLEEEYSIINYFQNRHFLDVVIFDSKLSDSTLVFATKALNRYCRVKKVLVLSSPWQRPILRTLDFSLTYDATNGYGQLPEMMFSVLCQTELSIGNSKSASAEDILDNKISETLLRFKIKSSNAGFRYLKDLLKYIITNKDARHNNSRTLYPIIAARNHTTSMRVEKAIRHTLDLCYQAFENLPDDSNLKALFDNGPLNCKSFINKVLILIDKN